jgi:hypothetical protein
LVDITANRELDQTTLDWGRSKNLQVHLGVEDLRMSHNNLRENMHMLEVQCIRDDVRGAQSGPGEGPHI